VWLDLSPRALSCAFDKLLVRRALSGLLKGQPFSGIQDVADQEDGAVKEQVLEKSVGELCNQSCTNGSGAGPARV